MSTQEINEALARLSDYAGRLEDLYIEAGGEVNDETEQLEGEIAALRLLLTTEGVDSLGRWLKSKQDALASAKAEKAAADRRVKSIQNTIDYVKGEITRLLQTTGTEKVKGTYYSFAQAVSTTAKVDAEALDTEYLDLVTEAARDAGLPAFVDVALTTTATRLKEAGEDAAPYLHVTNTDTVRFTKPRAAKED